MTGTGQVNKKLVVFGAGRIGRSFIGQLFSRGGYEVVFADSYEPIIRELNFRHNYNVVIRGETTEVLNIKNVRGVFTGQVDDVAREITDAGILAVSVGSAGLSKVIPLIARGLVSRFELDPGSPVDIIIAENLRNASDYFYNELRKELPETYPLDKLVGLVETSIGKMVPIMQGKDIEEDQLQVFAEPYNTLILDQMAFKNPIPVIPGLSPKTNMKAWVDRKLFIHNLGHATAAYLGYQYNPAFVYIYEALRIPELHNQVRETMLQSAKILLKKYPLEFTLESITQHIDDLLNRFQNQALGDTIYRVGCDLKRKLGPEDRLAGAIKLAIELDLPYNLLIHSLIAGCHFRATDENGNLFDGDIEFANEFQKGINAILTGVCGFDKKMHSGVFTTVRIVR